MNTNTQFTIFVIFLAMSSLCATTTFASPANPYPYNFTQPNGTNIGLIDKGDEFFAWTETLDGYPVQKNGGGWLTYIPDAHSISTPTLSVQSEETSYIVGVANPLSLKIKRTLLTPDAIQEIQRKRAESEFGNNPEKNMFSISSYQSSYFYDPVIGNQKIIVLLIQFPDKPKSESVSNIVSRFFDSGGSAKSVRTYYKEVSYNKLDLSGDVKDNWYTATHNMAYYGADNEQNLSYLALEAIDLADPSVDFSKYSSDGKFVDHLFIVHAGDDDATDGNPQTNGDNIWSRRLTINKQVDGVTIRGAAVVAEKSPLGLLAHEMGHDLVGSNGRYLPDLYDYDYSSDGVGVWDLMGFGNWLGPSGSPGTVPAQLSAWSKTMKGWLEPVTVGESKIAPLPKVETGGTKVYKIDINTNEYFLLENREKTLFDFELPGEGLLVWHIDESRSSERNDNEFYKLVDLEEAHGGKQHLDTNESEGPFGIYGNNVGDDKDPFYKKCWWITDWFCQNNFFSPFTDPNSTSNDGTKTNIGVLVLSPPGDTMSVFIDPGKTLSVPTQINGAIKTNIEWSYKINIQNINKLKVSLNWLTNDRLVFVLTPPAGTNGVNLTSSSWHPAEITLEKPWNGVWTITIIANDLSQDILEYTLKAEKILEEPGGVNLTNINFNFASTCENNADLKFVASGNESTNGQKLDDCK